LKVIEPLLLAPQTGRHALSALAGIVLRGDFLGSGPALREAAATGPCRAAFAATSFASGIGAPAGWGWALAGTDFGPAANSFISRRVFADWAVSAPCPALAAPWAAVFEPERA
jgi:hypothetical protein